MILNLRFAVLGYCVPFLVFLAYLFFSKRRVNKLLLWGVGLYPVILIYAVNPYWRFYSYHGLLHTSMVYQILEQGLPPVHPYLAGEPLRYSWGYHALAALVVRALNLSPSLSFALINVVCLALVLLLIDRISSRVLNDDRAGAFSVILAVFALTVIPRNLWVLRTIQFEGVPLFAIEARGVPVFEKFINVNGAPLGLVFFLLALHSIVRLFQGGRPPLHAFLLGVGAAGCGFFYAPFLPGLGVGALAACAARGALESRRLGRLPALRRLRWPFAGLAGGLVLILPYFIGTSSGAAGKVQLLHPGFTLANSLGYLIVFAPALVILYLGRRVLRESAERQGVLTLIAFILANSLCYIVLHLPSHNEYKFLVLLSVPLGILAGVAFRGMMQRYDRRILFLCFLPLLLPLYDVTEGRSRWFSKVPHHYGESGGNIYSLNEEEDEMNQWIRENTPPSSVFLNSEFTLPVLARRRLWIGMLVPPASGKDDPRSLGFFNTDNFLGEITGHPRSLLEARKATVKKVYESARELSWSDFGDLLESGFPAYVIARSDEVRAKLDRLGFQELFRSSEGRLSVFKIAKPAQEAVKSPGEE